MFISQMYLETSRKQNATENEIHLMKPFLLRHIEIVSLKILVTVGGSSAKAVLNINGGI